MTLRRISPAVVALFGIATIVIAEQSHDPAEAQFKRAEFVTAGSQPSNVGDAKIAALAYHDSGAYDRDLAAVIAKANRWLAQRVSSVSRPALILDIDETALSNWEIIQLDDFGRPVDGPCVIGTGAPCGWADWDQLGRDPAIAPTLELYRKARALGLAVYFITGRPESQRSATERNLAAVGYSGYEKLYMVPHGSHFRTAVDFKAPIRAEVEQAGYTILINMGDQPSDLEGGHAERTFLLPNPFYRVP
jgi:predicted secreted acid phosphatase